MNTLNWVDRSILGTLTGLQMISNELGIDFYQILKHTKISSEEISDGESTHYFSL